VLTCPPITSISAGAPPNKHGLTPQPITRVELTAFVREEDDKWSTVVRERKITAFVAAMR